MIPGMTGPVASMVGAGNIPLVSVAFLSSSTAINTPTIAVPTGHRSGDLALLYDWCYVENNGGNPTSVVPAGFTNFQTALGFSGEVDPPDFGRCRVNISYRIFTGSEPVEMDLTGMSGNRPEAKILLMFRGNVSIQAVVPGGMNSSIPSSNAAVANPPNQTIAALGRSTPLIAYAFSAKNATPVNWSTQTPLLTQTVHAGAYALGGYRVYNEQPANHTIGVNIGTSGPAYGINLFSGYLELS